MFRKNYYLFIVAIALFLAGSLTTFAQTSEISGRVELKKTDGTTEPVAGALIEVYRIDKKVTLDPVKTDAAGNFTVTKVPNEGEYVLAVSGEKIKTEVSEYVKFGAKNVNFLVSPGDGSRYSEAQIREALDKAGGLTAEERKAREEAEAKNKKILSETEVINKALSEGVKAFTDKNYDLAIVKFEEGYQANTGYVGSAPILLNNKGAALIRRALLNYNTMVQSKDKAQKDELRPKVNKDFEDAIATFSQAWTIIKSAKPDEVAKIQKDFDENKARTLTSTQDAVNLMIKTEATSEPQKDNVRTLINEYIAFEKDSKKKETAQLELGLYMMRVFDFENAVAEYRKALVIAPNNPDAIGGLGLSLYMASFESADTAKKQEALNYMQHFLDSAPEKHPLREGIDSGVEDLKAQKLKPQKISAKN